MFTAITETAKHKFEMQKVIRTLKFIDDYFDLATNGCEFRCTKFLNETDEDLFLLYLESYTRTICAHALNTWLSRRERGGVWRYNGEIYDPEIPDLLISTEKELEAQKDEMKEGEEKYHAFMLWKNSMKHLAGFGDKLAEAI